MLGGDVEKNLKGSRDKGRKTKTPKKDKEDKKVKVLKKTKFGADTAKAAEDDPETAKGGDDQQNTDEWAEDEIIHMQTLQLNELKKAYCNKKAIKGLFIMLYSMIIAAFFVTLYILSRNILVSEAETFEHY